MEGTDASQRAVLSALAQLPSLHTLELPVTDVSQLVGSEEVGVEVLAAAELNLCEYNKAGLEALLQRLGPYVNKVTITLPVLTGRVNFGRPVLSPANLQALAALSTKKGIAFELQD
ncbi:hypothetical protein HaLaN_19165, partial [Haematococcus lacustris]